MEIDGLQKITALAHRHRLDVFRLLMRRAPEALAAGEIARTLDLPSSTLSPYLAALKSADLIREGRAGTSRLYAANTDGAAALVDYLVNECCRGRPAQCFDTPEPTPEPARPFNVLFICTGNSARSIMAEALLRDIGAGKFHAYSAGTTPYDRINPAVLRLLSDKGIDTDTLRAKPLTEFQGANAPKFDFVFTVCDAAANEECPAWAGQPISAHWGQPDPVAVKGTEAEQQLAFQQVYGGLKNRITAFAALPFDQLNRMALQRHVDQIASLETEI